VIFGTFSLAQVVPFQRSTIGVVLRSWDTGPVSSSGAVFANPPRGRTVRPKSPFV
jgi:hypothetical protein